MAWEAQVAGICDWCLGVHVCVYILYVVYQFFFYNLATTNLIYLKIVELDFLVLSVSTEENTGDL